MENMIQPKNKDSSHQQQELSPWEKMAQEVIIGKSGHEAIEKKFYKTHTEFNGDEFDKFRNELFDATPDDAKKIIDSRIFLLEEKADKTKAISPSRFDQHIHRGYISRDTTVSFETYIGSQYKLKDTEYLYDIVEYLRNKKERIRDGSKLFEHIAGFLNSYFGIPDTSKDRWTTIEKKLVSNHFKTIVNISTLSII